MYRVTIKDPKDAETLLELNTEKRAYARAVKLCGEENGLLVDVMVDVAPRVVKFKMPKPKE